MTTECFGWREIEMAHHAVCTCGGSEPGEGCAACEMYHKLKEYSEKLEATD